MTDVPGGALFVHNNGFTVLQRNADDMKKMTERYHFRAEDQKTYNSPLMVRSHAYRVEFEGASSSARMTADKALPTYNNYFIGNDPTKWASDCKLYQGITLHDIYPNIDVRYYSENGSMKYEFVVNPGGDVNRIAMKFRGSDGLAVKDNILNIKTSVGTVRELAPYSYQYTENGKQEIGCTYRLKDSTVHFKVKKYDPSSVLVIDPTIIFASFTGSSADNWGFTATYGPDGSMFGGGIVFGNGFPVSPGAFQQNFSGNPFDMGIIKLSPDGINRVYATYIGGAGEDQPHSLFCDAAGNLVIAGRSNSANFPIVGSSPAGGGFDLVVVKLNPAGTALIGSKKIGGSGDDGVNISTSRARQSLEYNYGDDGRSEVIVDGAGNIYVASCTKSSDFPLTNAFQNSFGGSQDGVVIKLSPDLSSILYASYLGGSADDAAYVLSLNPGTGDLYVGGGTASTNFPGVTATVLGTSNHGGIDGFISIIKSNGTLVKSTYLGTGAVDQVYGVQFDKFGYPYVMGQTLGDWQHVNASFYQPGGRQFIAKLQPDLSAFVYSTTFGTPNASQPNISPVAFLVDRCENVYVSGWGGIPYSAVNTFTSAGTTGLPVTPDALVMNPPYNSPSETDGRDFYYFVLKKNASAQLYGSFFGEKAFDGVGDHVDGGTSRFDPNGVIYQAQCANCNSPHPYFPHTDPVWAAQNGSIGCNLAMVKIALNLAGLHTGVQSAIDGQVRDTAGCLPLLVNFRDTIANAVTYEWDFNGDGVTDTITNVPNSSYIYNAIGTYHVRLIAVDANSCNLRDTSFVNIKVGVLKATPEFTVRKLQPCEALNFQFTNTTFQPPSRPFTSASFVWDFGDGSQPVTSGYGPVTHAFPSPGSYHIKLSLVDTGYCNAPETKDSVINIATLAKANFETPPSGCVPYLAAFTNTSSGGQQFFWNFGDGTTSRDITPPPHLYADTGLFVVKLRIIDTGTCNKTDSIQFTIRVNSKPVAGIGNVTPQPPVTNKPITFQNTSSSDATSFVWQFGDGDSIATASRQDVSHEFNETKVYTVLLIAYNGSGCSDTARKQVQTLVEPAIDVPNAFTPLTGGVNGVVYARGFDIAKLKFTIWNRWGQKMFETSDRKQGWDGRYKGEVQPMDVYTYTLDVEFFDGKKATKKGDITLIR